MRTNFNRCTTFPSAALSPKRQKANATTHVNRFLSPIHKSKQCLVWDKSSMICSIQIFITRR